MGQQFYLLYDELGFQEDNRNFLNSIQQPKALRSANIEFFLSVKGGYGSVPTIYFNNATDEGIFFQKINRESFVIAFTSLPIDELKEFDNKYFQDSKNTIKIKCQLMGNKKGQQATFSRWIVFKKEVDRPADVFQNTKLINTLTTEQKANPLIYKTYISPVELSIDDDNIFPYYSSLSKNRQQLPFILPPEKPKEVNTYFGDYSISGRIIGPLPLLRQKFREYVLAFEQANPNSLFVELWKMTDNPILTEYLADGSSFDLRATIFEEWNNQLITDTQESPGFPLITFYYPAQELNPDNVLARWKSDLLEPVADSSSSIDAIKKSILNDIRHSIPGLKSQIIRSAKNLRKTWDTISTPNFNTYKVKSGTGEWHDIARIRDGLSIDDTELKDFINAFVLYPSEQGGKQDHDLALLLFSEYLCKFPFNVVNSHRDNWENGLEPDFKLVWALFFLEFIKNKGNMKITDVAGSVKIENGICIYSDPLSPEQLFRLRLMLPSTTRLESTFSSILDYQNALDFNFTL